MVVIDRLAFGGEGVGRLEEGKVVFVPWTIPGDKVRVKIVSDHGRFARAELVEILDPSSARVEPRCPVFGACGGCQWQHIQYEDQLRWKEAILKDSLERAGKISNPPVLPIIASPHPWNYRSRIQLKTGSEGQIGFYRFHSHEVVPFEECHIADPILNQKLAQIRQNGRKDLGAFELSIHPSPSVYLGTEERVFSQVNAHQNQQLVATLMDFAFGNAEKVFTKKKNVVELHAGSGNFTFDLALRAGQIVAIESNAAAIKEGSERAERDSVANIEWVEGTAEWGLKKIYRRKLSVDILVLDPPRRGAVEILDLIPLIKPRMILYVSCDPMTLARDLSMLLKRHYRLEKVQPIDMFPQTYHIESVVQLSLL